MFKVDPIIGFLPGKNASPQVKNGHMLAIATQRPNNLVIGEHRVFVASRFTKLGEASPNGNVPAVPRKLPEEGNRNFDFSDWLEYEIIQVFNLSAALMPLAGTWKAAAFPSNYVFRKVTESTQKEMAPVPFIEPEGDPPVDVVVVVTDENGDPVGQGDEELPIFP